MAEALCKPVQEAAPDILYLDDEALTAILVEASKDGPRGALDLASTCRRCALVVERASNARMLHRLQLGVAGRPPFGGCEKLVVVAEDEKACSWAPGVLAAAAHMPNLQKLQLDTETGWHLDKGRTVYDVYGHEGYDTWVAGFVWPITGWQQLRNLSFQTAPLGPLTAASLGCLTQLTRLELRCSGRPRSYSTSKGSSDVPATDLSPLSRLTRLVELVVADVEVIQPPASAAGPYYLPSSLRCLELEYGRGKASESGTSWLQHLPGCPQLTHLDLGSTMVRSDNIGVVLRQLEMVERATPGLQNLTLPSSGASWTGPPPAEPLPGLPTLPSVQQLRCLGGDMPLRDDGDWWALRVALPALTRLSGNGVLSAPPQGWQYKCLQQLEVILSGGREWQWERVAMQLMTLPALQRAGFRLACSTPVRGAGSLQQSSDDDDSEVADTPSDAGYIPTVVPASPHLTSLSIRAFSYDTPAACLAPLIAAASNSLVELELGGRMEPRHPQFQLVDLSACTALTRLSCYLSEEAGVGDAVRLVQPLAPTLRALTFEDWRSLTPASVEVLQQVLPRLEHISFGFCEPEEREQLQQRLRPGLTQELDFYWFCD